MALSQTILLSFLGLIALASPISYHNSYKSSFCFYCPEGKALGSFHSLFSSSYKDRRYKFDCDAYIGTYTVSRDCFMNSYVNGDCQSFTYSCPPGYAATGVYSTYTGQDRRWKFRCCRTPTCFGYNNCQWKSNVNSYCSSHSYYLPAGAIVRGYKSSFNSYYRDRVWSVKVCRWG